MKSEILQVRKTWFEVRIFISLSIVTAVSFASFCLFKNSLSSLEIAGSLIGLSNLTSLHYGFLFMALIVLFASLIRMWAGSILTSQTVMKFRVQNSNLNISGPYQYVRHPIYFADLMVFTSLSLCLKPVGLLIPFLIWIHYQQLIRYEEEKLISRFGTVYNRYRVSVPGLCPGIKEIKKLFNTPFDLSINFDGFRHNAQYILFIPGLMVASLTGNFIYAILIGLPAVIDWAIIHTIIGVSSDVSKIEKSAATERKINHSKVFRDILYSQCWEDPEMDRKAFKIKKEDIVFSITSGGCNALAFLPDDPAQVICLDMNRFQNYLLSLKICAFKNLEYNELLEFLGVNPSRRRWKFYQILKTGLSIEEQHYWDNKKTDIKKGILHSGKYERYMHLLRNIFRILIGRRIIKKLFEASDIKDQRRLFNKKWDNSRWRIFCRIFLCRRFASMFFDKDFYKYIDPSFSFEKYYRCAVRRAITELPVRENYFLAYILLGHYITDNLPVYLKKENFNLIKNRVDRIKIVTSGCREYLSTLPEDTISEFNFTNIFEWMSVEDFTCIMGEILRTGKDNAVITYRNHLVTRGRPEIFAAQIIPDIKLSAELRNTDRSFIYKAYVVERINKKPCHS